MPECVRASLRVALGGDGDERRSVSPYAIILPFEWERRVPVTASARAASVDASSFGFAGGAAVA
eukprot:3859033-Prymnesium_polylepis.1